MSFWKAPLILQAHKIGVKVAIATAYLECQKPLKEDCNVSLYMKFNSN